MQNEWAGAQAFSGFDTYLAPFVKADSLTYKEVKQAIQSFIYGVNTPSRWGTQAPFTNITLDWTVPDDMAELNCIVGGKEMPFKYKDCVEEMKMVNKAFIEVMQKKVFLRKTSRSVATFRNMLFSSTSGTSKISCPDRLCISVPYTVRPHQAPLRSLRKSHPSLPNSLRRPKP